MENIGYTGGYIGEIRRLGHWIISQGCTTRWNDYSEIEAVIREIYHNRHTLTNNLRSLRVIYRYDVLGELPDGHKHFHTPSRYDNLSEGFKGIVDTACMVISGNGKNPSSAKYALISFLSDMQSAGAVSLADITQEAVLQAFSPKGTPIKSQSFKYNVEYGLRACSSVYGEALIGKVITYLPCIPAFGRNIQFLTPEEIQAISKTITHDSSISLQDKAIITIALHTGMRGCDICALRISSIDWHNDRLSITQSKTGRPLELPMRAVVGNALFDYITQERPDTDLPYVFLSVNHPYRRLHTSNLDAICVKIMHKSGIRTGKKDRKGIHLFRHNIATSMLAKGVAQPIISSTLGHASPHTLRHYLDADLQSLKACGLSISAYPVGKEVFGQ
ncbi:tyrosine-type recombinase/integrase [Muribaculum intestinale]|nr:tyrosine-type recombinase/integrase [Muribaculum intestinale]